ncbi:MAG: hypothetical protein FJZ10_04785 [Candidatus Omnitrophica bacterium]|nr:hypothetical protein [Candidatus Omnitrophota bacterium]
MNDLISLIGMIFAIAGLGMLAVLLVTLANGQMPANFFGIFLITSPFIFILIAAFILTRRKA